MAELNKSVKWSSINGISRKSSLLILALSLLQSACHPYEKEPPVNLIPQDTLVEVYRDLVLADSKFSKKVSSTDSIKTIQYADALSVLKKYGLSQQRYDSSMTYYRLSENKMEDILGEVIQQLKKRRITLEKKLKSSEQEKLEPSSE